MKNYILKGDILYAETPKQLTERADSFLVCTDGRTEGVYRSFLEIPEAYRGFPLHDYSGRLIVPGLCDLHLHAPQYGFRALWMDMELMDWLNEHTFPEEAKYRDPAYAEEAYTIFAEDMKRGATARLCVFATVHTDAALRLSELLSEAGLCGFVGKVNMDRNAPEALLEDSEESYRETLRFLSEMEARCDKGIRPILTPRFIPSCTDGLMEKLGALARERRLPLQSHLSESRGEIETVAALCPWAAYYGEAYERPGCFGGDGLPCVMAHCVWSGEAERRRMKKNGVMIAHCPSSNTNLASGIAPVRRYLNEGLSVGLGTDIAGGSTKSVFRVMADAIQVSKLYFRLVDESLKPLTVQEAFYLGTRGGGAFFGKCGSFEKGYEFDALVLSEEAIPTGLKPLTLTERLERFLYLADERDVCHKYVAGRQLF